METQKLMPEETHGEKQADEESADEDVWGFPSSSPDKKILTGRALLESGLVGIWKDRTDIVDTLEYARKLRERANKRLRGSCVQLPEDSSEEMLMATRRPMESVPESTEEEDFTIPEDEKPKTAQDLYQALVNNGFIGAWKDRADMADPSEYVQRLKDQARERRQKRIRQQFQG